MVSKYFVTIFLLMSESFLLILLLKLQNFCFIFHFNHFFPSVFNKITNYKKGYFSHTSKSEVCNFSLVLLKFSKMPKLQLKRHIQVLSAFGINVFS